MHSNLFLFLWCSVIALGNFHYGYSLNEIDQISNITPCIYNFLPGSREWYNLLFTQIIPMMAALVSYFVYKVSPLGKRKIMLFIAATVILSSCIKMFRSLSTLIIGQMITGACTGVSSIICPLFIAEICPLKYRGGYIGLAQLFITIGIMTSLITGLTFPNFSEPENKGYCDDFDDQLSWRYLFIVPAIPSAIQIILLLLFFKEENPNFYGRRASSSYQRLEEDSDPAEDRTHSLNMLLPQEVYRETSGDKSLFNISQTQRCLSQFFQQLTGINMIIYYSHFFKLHNDMNQLNLRLLVGLCNFVMTPISLYIAAVTRRKPLFLIGFMICAACNTMLFQVFDIEELGDSISLGSLYTIFAISFIMLFIIAFSLTLGTITWVYTAEVMNDWEMGIANMTHWSTNFMINLLPTLAALLDPSHETDKNQDRYTGIFFLLYSGACLCGFFFTIVYVKESIMYQKQRTPIQQESLSEDSSF
ncbi:unnamed protein product [Moneuplotes crassus]|uniref:Hexose transporter 1 n=1 Tax=Euplotes crassus TaxID=5936 RepID=A0AAD1U8W8_EUPCR|nr:unnamed protein product [Moneuplotes crassus]